MLSPRFIPQSVFYTQSVVRSPQSMFYTDRVKSQPTVTYKMADLVQWHSRRTVKQKKKRKEKERDGEIESFGLKPVCPLAPPFLLFVF